jgi:hypothetical protein
MKRINVLKAIVFSGLFACGEKQETGTSEEDVSNEESSEETSVRDCTELTVEECACSLNCSTIGGVPMTENDDGTCYYPEELELYGCMSATLSCEPTLVFSFNPDGSGLVQFPSSCVPEGWEFVDLFNFQECDD